MHGYALRQSQMQSCLLFRVHVSNTVLATALLADMQGHIKLHLLCELTHRALTCVIPGASGAALLDGEASLPAG